MESQQHTITDHLGRDRPYGSNNTDISTSGTLKNMLDSGSSLPDSIRELFDNSDDWHASRIKIFILPDDNVIVIADNGIGMDRNKLEHSVRIATRIDASNDKSGKFGVGYPQALITLTMLKGSSRTISMKDNKLNEITINWADAVRTGDMKRIAHEITESGRNLWNKYSLENNGSGTITYIKSTNKVIEELNRLLITHDIQNNLHYLLATTYHINLSNNLTINLSIDGITTNILPNNPLNKISDNSYTDTKQISVYENGNNYRYYYYADKNKYGYLDFSKSIRGSFKNKQPAPGWKCIGEYLIEAIYCDDWSKHDKEILNKCNITYLQEKTKGRQEQQNSLGGIWYIRNNRVLFHEFREKGSSGDKNLYVYTENTRLKIIFIANDKIDKLTGVCTDKSSRTDMTDSNLKNTINTIKKRICVDFGIRDKQIKRANKVKDYLTIDPKKATLEDIKNAEEAKNMEDNNDNAEVTTDIDSNPESDAETDTDVSTDADAETDAETDADADADAETDVSTDADTDADADADANVSADVDAEANVSADVDAEANVSADVDADANVSADVDADANVSADVDADANVSADVDADANVSADVDADANVSADVDADANVSADVDADANVSADVDAEANVSADVDADANVSADTENHHASILTTTNVASHTRITRQEITVKALLEKQILLGKECEKVVSNANNISKGKHIIALKGIDYIDNLVHKLYK